MNKYILLICLLISGCSFEPSIELRNKYQDKIVSKILTSTDNNHSKWYECRVECTDGSRITISEAVAEGDTITYHQNRWIVADSINELK